MTPVEYGFEPNNTNQFIRNYAGITINVRQNITVCTLFGSEAVDIGSTSLKTRTMMLIANDRRGAAFDIDFRSFALTEVNVYATGSALSQ
jgi:hypothetical protein